MLVNLIYRIGVHINFAQPPIPALVCSLPYNQNTVATRRVARGNGGNVPTISKFAG